MEYSVGDVVLCLDKKLRIGEEMDEIVTEEREHTIANIDEDMLGEKLYVMEDGSIYNPDHIIRHATEYSKQKSNLKV